MSNNALSESFDNGTGVFGNAWNVDTSTRGEVKFSGNSGLMEWGGNNDSGHGYGTYTITAKVDGSQPGPGIILWPGDNHFPGQEIDMLEVTPDGSGRQYGTVHWDGGGYDVYTPRIFDGVGGGTFHQYQMTWDPGKITFRVDGAEKGVVTDHVPTDHDHGGMNNTIGFLNNNSGTSLTVSQVDFSPIGGSSSFTAPAAVQEVVAPAPEQASAPAASTPAPVDSGPVDWGALAAQATANYEATGHWFI